MPDQIPQALHNLDGDPILRDIFSEQPFSHFLATINDTVIKDDYSDSSPIFSPESDFISTPQSTPALSSFGDVEEQLTCNDFDLFTELADFVEPHSSRFVPSPSSSASSSYYPPSPALSFASPTSPLQCNFESPAELNFKLLSERAKKAANTAANSATVEISLADLNALIEVASANWAKRPSAGGKIPKLKKTVRASVSPYQLKERVENTPAPAAEPPSPTLSVATLSVAAPARRKVTQVHACHFPDCGRTFTRKYNLTTHLGTHDPNRARPFQCHRCPKSFVRSPDLIRHEAVHNNERQEHVCACGRAYARRDALARHLATCEDAFQEAV
ncbi:hypothetical protein HDV00_007786 [Rhizophlyctis rosea]|nr:hypothetical protein HDV00_007786 [Rhizophlyctis rosea]